MRRRIAMALATTTLLVAACASNGGSGTSTPAASGPAGSEPSSATGGSGSPQACGLLTVDEIAGVVGNAVEDGTGMTTADCTWGSDPDETSASVLVTGSGTEQICADALGSDDGQVPIDGLGKPAFWLWNPVSGGVGSVSICADGSLVTVTVSAGLDDPADESGVRGRAEALAQLVLGRI